MDCLNWDLGSVVRSCYAIKGSSLKTNPSVAMAANPHSTMSSINNDTLVSPNGNCNQVFGDDKGSFSCPTILESQYGVSNDNSILQATNTFIGTTSSIHISHMAHIDQDAQNQKIEYANFSPSFNSPFVPQKHSMHAHAKAPPSSSVMHLSNQPTFLGKSASHYFQGSYYFPSIMSSQSRPKRMGRRNEKKKICRQVKREDKGNDEWTWRKYGQKAIKGSIHPRSYYRCISSKGCPARKQVQRSPTEPNMFIITYTGEHAHAMLPNSNAGNSRARYPRPDHKHKENSNINLIKKVQVDDVDSMNDHKLDAMIAHDHDDFFVELEELDMYQGSSGGCNTSGDFSFDNFFSAPTWAPGNSSTGDGCDGRVSE